MGEHVHLYFGAWQNESRAWRAGKAALNFGYADSIRYVGHRVQGLVDQESIGDKQVISRIGPKPAQPGSSRLRRAAALPQWWSACLNAAPGPSTATMVVAHSLAALPAGVKYARKFRLPLLYDAHELETERSGWPAGVRRLAKIFERRLIKSCDHVLVVNESIRDWYENAYPGIEFTVVRNIPENMQRHDDSTLRESLNIPFDAIVFVYCGNMGYGRGILELIQAFHDMPRDRHLVLIGDGPERDEFKNLGKYLSTVHFVPAVPQKDLVDLLSGADVGVSVLEESALSYHYALPNKIFEYAAAGLALCVSRGPELQRFIKGYPSAKTADLTVENLRKTLLTWTRNEINEAKIEIGKYKLPDWQTEQKKLIDAYGKTMIKGQERWQRQ